MKYKMLVQFFLAGLILSGQIATPAELDGQDIPGEISFNNSTYLVNGCGTREMLWQLFYQVALYLQEKTSNRDVVLNADTAKLVRLKVLYEEQLPDELPGIWQEPLHDEISKEMLGIVQGMYDEISTGDVLLFSYHPETGTTVSLNNDNVITGRDTVLMSTLLENWLGDEPVSGNLKRLLLDKTCP